MIIVIRQFGLNPRARWTPALLAVLAAMPAACRARRGESGAGERPFESFSQDYLRQRAVDNFERASARAAELFGEGSAAYRSGDFAAARHSFEEAAGTDGLEARIYPISDSASLIPLDQFLFPAVEERFGKPEAKAPGAWIDLDSGHAVLDPALAERIAGAFFPSPAQKKLFFAIGVRVFRLHRAVARRWAEKLTGSATREAWKRELTAEDAKALEAAVAAGEEGLKIEELPIVTTLDRRRTWVSSVSRRPYLADYHEVARDGKKAPEPLIQTLETGTIIDLLPIAEEESTVQVLLQFVDQFEVLERSGESRDVPRISTSVGDAPETVVIEVPQLILRSSYRIARVTVGSPGVMLGYCLTEEKTGVVWFHLRVRRVD